MNWNKKKPRMKTPVFCIFKYWDDRHEPRDIWVNWRLLLDMIDDAERGPKLAIESPCSNIGSVLYQKLNFIKVVEPCVTCKVGLTIWPSHLTVTVKIKRDHVYVKSLESCKMF